MNIRNDTFPSSSGKNENCCQQQMLTAVASCFEACLQPRTRCRRKVIEHSWRASVVLLLRWTGAETYDQMPPGGRLLSSRADKLELLFIKRACRAGDPWSGHIAFPGGKREPSDHDDMHCALRETMEELGLDLANSSRFQFLGQLDDLEIPSRDAARLQGALSAFVYLLIATTEITACSLCFAKTGLCECRQSAVCCNPSVREVSAVFWVPLSEIMYGSNAFTTHRYGLDLRKLSFVASVIPRKVLASLGLSSLLLAAVDISKASKTMIWVDENCCCRSFLESSRNVVHSSMDARRTQLTQTDALGAATQSKSRDQVNLGAVEICRKHEKDAGVAQSVLWGLSLRAASNMIEACGGRRIDRPQFVFENVFLAKVMYFVSNLCYLVGSLCRRDSF